MNITPHPSTRLSDHAFHSCSSSFSPQDYYVMMLFDVQEWKKILKESYSFQHVCHKALLKHQIPRPRSYEFHRCSRATTELWISQV